MALVSRVLVTPRVEILSANPSGINRSTSVSRRVQINATLANGGAKGVETVEYPKTNLNKGKHFEVF